jgi:DNA-directed RNA polymerase subunit alpha
MRVGDRTDYDKLSLEVETDGTITPEEAFYSAAEILIKHFSIIFENKPETEMKEVESAQEEEPVKEKKAKEKKATKKSKK